MIDPYTPQCPAPAGPVERSDDPLAALAGVLGGDKVRRDAVTRQHYARSTATTNPAPDAVAFPETTGDVQRLVRVAGRYGLKLHPISRGCNWGYGDAAPPTNGQIVVDLGRMNRIVALNRAGGHVVVEPGVTQGQLFDYLQAHAPELWMDCTGAGRGASLIGNVLDRGFGHTRYGDHVQTCCGMEVVLPDGRLLRTGLTHYENAQAAHAYPYGVGPALDGLFQQSNVGIVTRIGLWLMPRPEAFCAFFFRAADDAMLDDLVNRLAALRRQGVLQSTIHIANDLRAVSARHRDPRLGDPTGDDDPNSAGQTAAEADPDAAEDRTPLTDDERARLRQQHAVGAWNGAGALYGTAGMVKAMKKRLRRDLKPFGVRFVDDRLLGLAERATGVMGRLGFGAAMREQLHIIRPVYGLLKGEPSDEPLRGVHWRSRQAMPERPVDPRETPTGFLWTSPVLPNDGRSARAVVELITPIYHAHGFDPLITFTMITERAMIAVTNMSFDRRFPAEVAAAEACHEQLNTALIAAGYIPYRSSPRGYAKLRQAGSTFWEIAMQLKRTLDPQDTISPGRYLPSLR